jgi:hypothetical protein
MGKFNNKISAEFNPPRKWVLERALSYKNDDIDMGALEKVGVKCPANRITCKKNFVTDLASVPRMCWAFIAPWDVARAAIIHDLLYKRIRQYRAENEDEKDLNINRIINAYNDAKKVADKVFLAAMLDAQPSVAKWKIYSAYYAVVLFGRWSIIPRKEDLL